MLKMGDTINIGEDVRICLVPVYFDGVEIRNYFLWTVDICTPPFRAGDDVWYVCTAEQRTQMHGAKLDASNMYRMNGNAAKLLSSSPSCAFGFLFSGPARPFILPRMS